jgi:hypothetical protein
VITDSGQRVKAAGLLAKTSKFKFIFGCKFSATILKQLDQLSSSLQDPSLSALESFNIAQLSVRAIEKIRSDFDLFYSSLLNLASKLEVSAPELPRKRKRPAKIMDYGSSSTAFVPATAKEIYKRVYVEAVDMTVNSVKDKFDQPDFRQYIVLQELLLKAFKNDDYTAEMDKILSDYSTDFDKQTLGTELVVLSSLGLDAESGFSSLHEYFSKRERRIRFPLSTKLFKLILVLPATNAVSERSFSKMKS